MDGYASFGASITKGGFKNTLRCPAPAAVIADLEIMAEQIRKIKLLGAEILAKNCGQTVEKILKDFDRDYWMDAKESVAYGIVDGILEKI